MRDQKVETSTITVHSEQGVVPCFSVIACIGLATFMHCNREQRFRVHFNGCMLPVNQVQYQTGDVTTPSLCRLARAYMTQ